jgi:hypothetical protein
VLHPICIIISQTRASGHHLHVLQQHAQPSGLYPPAAMHVALTLVSQPALPAPDVPPTPPGAVESLWSIDQYFEFVLVLMLSTGLAFQVSRSRHLVNRQQVALALVLTPVMSSTWKPRSCPSW